MKKNVIFIIAVVIMLCVPAISIAEPLDNWYLRHDAATLLFGVTYGNGTFVAVGYEGTILSSPDGMTWTERTSNTTESLNGATYGEGIFVVVGDHGTILISSDGENWITRTGYSGTTHNLNAIAYGNGIFVAVAD